MLTGTLTLDPITLPEPCNAVYLLDDTAIPADGGILYEATLNGVTWIEVIAGQITAINQTGTTLQVRATLTLADGSPNTVQLFWFLAYGTQEA